MLDDALRYPLASDDRVSTLLVGGLILVLPTLATLSTLVVGPLGLVALIVTLPFTVVAQGYLLDVLRSAATGDSAAPSFTGWGRLFVDGLKLMVVSAAHGLLVAVPTVAVAVVLGVGSALLRGGAAAPPTEPNVAALSALTLLGFAAIALSSLAVAYVLPAALTNLALRGSLRAAFALGTIRQVVLTSEYLVGVLLGAVIGAVLGSIAFGISLLLVGIPLVFYSQVAAYYCLGRGFAEARASMGVGSERVD